MQELAGFGVPSIALAGCTKDPTPALFCMGTDVARSAYLGTKELLKALGNKGNIAHFTGFLVDPNTQLRIQAVEKAVAEAGGGAKVVQVIADIDAPQPADEKINAFLAAQGKGVDGIITTAWVPSVVAATSLRNLGDKRIKMVGIDHDEVVLKAIKDGYVHGTMLQNPYGQGYIGSYALNLVRSGCKVKADAPFQKTAQTDHFIDSGTAFVDAASVDNYQDKMKAVTKEIMTDFKAKYLSCPPSLNSFHCRPPARPGGLPAARRAFVPALLGAPCRAGARQRSLRLDNRRPMRRLVNLSRGPNEVGLVIVIVLFGAASPPPRRASPRRSTSTPSPASFAIDAVIGIGMMVVIVTGGLNLALGAIGVCSVMLGGWLMQVAGCPAAAGSRAPSPSARCSASSTAADRAHRRPQLRRHARDDSLYFGAMIVLTGAQAFSTLPPASSPSARCATSPGSRRWSSWRVVAAALAFLLPPHRPRPRDPGRRRQARGAAALGRAGAARDRLPHALRRARGARRPDARDAQRCGHPRMAGQLGEDWLLPAFLAPVLGGTLLTGGRVSVSGTVLGALLVTMLSNGLLLLQIGEFWVQAFLGLILLAAVLLDKAARRSCRAPPGDRLMRPSARATDWFGPLCSSSWRSS